MEGSTGATAEESMVPAKSSPVLRPPPPCAELVRPPAGAMGCGWNKS